MYRRVLRRVLPAIGVAEIDYQDLKPAADNQVEFA
jgi:hypothetical protein